MNRNPEEIHKRFTQFQQLRAQQKEQDETYPLRFRTILVTDVHDPQSLAIAINLSQAGARVIGTTPHDFDLVFPRIHNETAARIEPLQVDVSSGLSRRNFVEKLYSRTSSNRRGVIDGVVLHQGHKDMAVDDYIHMAVELFPLFSHGYRKKTVLVLPDTEQPKTIDFFAPYLRRFEEFHIDPCTVLTNQETSDENVAQFVRDVFLRDSPAGYIGTV